MKAARAPPDIPSILRRVIARPRKGAAPSRSFAMSDEPPDEAKGLQAGFVAHLGSLLVVHGLIIVASSSLICLVRASPYSHEMSNISTKDS
ncbi:MAG: hypothetical protein ACR2N0_08815 [Rubrobacteraceae bacterium]|nr:hypothetical protein [Rubrobacter sp.]